MNLTLDVSGFTFAVILGGWIILIAHLYVLRRAERRKISEEIRRLEKIVRESAANGGR